MIFRFRPDLTDFKSDCCTRLYLLGDPKDFAALLLLTTGEEVDSGIFNAVFSSFFSSSSLSRLLFSALGILKLVDLKLEPRPSAKLARLELAVSGGVFGFEEPLNRGLKLDLADVDAVESDSELRCFRPILVVEGSYFGWLLELELSDCSNWSSERIGDGVARFDIADEDKGDGVLVLLKFFEISPANSPMPGVLVFLSGLIE